MSFLFSKSSFETLQRKILYLWYSLIPTFSTSLLPGLNSLKKHAVKISLVDPDSDRDRINDLSIWRSFKLRKALIYNDVDQWKKLSNHRYRSLKKKYRVPPTSGIYITWTAAHITYTCVSDMMLTETLGLAIWTLSWPPTSSRTVAVNRVFVFIT